MLLVMDITNKCLLNCCICNFPYVGVTSTIILIWTYTEDDIRIPEGTSNLSIIGAGIDATIWMVTDQTVVLLLIIPHVSSNITISDMTIKEMTANSSEKGGGGIRIEQSSGVVVEDIKFEDNKSQVGSTTGNTANWGKPYGTTLPATIRRCIFKQLGRW